MNQATLDDDWEDDPYICVPSDSDIQQYLNYASLPISQLATPFHFAGLKFTPHQTTIPAYIGDPNKPHCIYRILISVQEISVHDVLNHLQYDSKLLNETTFPKQIIINSKHYSLHYYPPLSDELIYGQHPHDTQFVGDRFLGTIHVTHQIDSTGIILNEGFQHTKQSKLRFKSWHSPQ